jgi:ATP phosphoribosyltransferase
MEIRYIGAYDEVEVPALGIIVERGVPVTVDDGSAIRLLDQAENWAPVDPAAYQALLVELGLAEARLRVATKYVQTAREHFAAKGVHVDLIKLYGSMELAPLTGLADAIVDLVSTGSTLKANHLVEVEHIMDISARLVVNQAALKLKQAPIRALIDAFAGALR